MTPDGMNMQAAFDRVLSLLVEKIETGCQTADDWRACTIDLKHMKDERDALKVENGRLASDLAATKKELDLFRSIMIKGEGPLSRLYQASDKTRELLVGRSERDPLTPRVARMAADKLDLALREAYEFCDQVPF